MKRLIGIALLTSVFLSWAEADPLALQDLDFGPKGEFALDGLRFSAGEFDLDWRTTSQAALAPEAGFPKVDGGVWALRGQLRPPNSDSPIQLEASLAESSGELLKATYEMKHPTGLPTRGAFLAIDLPVAVAAGRTYEIDGVKQSFPDHSDKITLVDEKAFAEKTVVLPTATGEVTLKGVTAVQIQDLRLKNRDRYIVRLRFGPPGPVLTDASLTVDITRRQFKSSPLPLGKAANRALRDDVANDGAGGWTDQGPENDLSALEPGPLTASGLSFLVADPGQNEGKSVLVLAGEKRVSRDLPKSAQVPVPKGTNWKNLYLLHASAAPPAGGKAVGHLRAQYADGTETVFDVISGQDVGDWWAPVDLPNGAVGWNDENPSSAIGLYVSRFPLEAKPLTSVKFEGEGAATWMVAAIAGSVDPLSPGHSAVPMTIQAGEEWAPYRQSLEIEKGSVFDFSFLADAPAGKYGALIPTPDGHFGFADRPEMRARFWGVNIVSSATVLDHQDADQLADRLVRSGYNAVRLHNYDAAILKPGGAPNEFDPAHLDHLDYLFSALKNRGISIVIDLFSVRGFAPSELAAFGLDPKLNRKDSKNPFKALIPLSEPAIASLQDFARRLFTHQNPYTGLTWADDPALIGVCPVNEQMLTPVSVAAYPQIDRLYQEAFAEWQKTTVRQEGETSSAFYVRFLTETQQRFEARILDFLHDLKIKALITGCNFRSFQSETYLREHYEYVDNHQYWDHPRGKMLFNQSQSTHHTALMPRQLMPARIFGKPYVVSEFNFVYPNRQRAEGGVLVPAYASLQDWDALLNYNYANSGALAMNGDITQGDAGFPFSLASDPIGLLADRSAALVFRRGDISAAKHAIAFAVQSPGAFEGEGKEFPAAFTNLGLVTRIGSRATSSKAVTLSGIVVPEGTPSNANGQTYTADADLAGKLEKEGILPSGSVDEAGQRFTSETCQIELRSAESTLKVVTERSELFVLASEGKSEGQFAKVENGRGFATVSVISVDGRPLASSRRILVLHLTDALLTGMRFSDHDGRRVEVEGKLPFLVRKGDAGIMLHLDKETEFEAWIVDATGKRVALAPLERVGDAWRLQMDTTSPRGTQLAYEIVAKNVGVGK